MARASTKRPTAPTAARTSAGTDDWPARGEITDHAAVLLLTDLRALKYLTPFLNGVHTLSSAAASLQCSTSTIAYWIPRFVRVGLLVHLGDQTRAGMAMPTYRAPASQLVVPFRSLPFDRRVAMLDSGRMRVLRRFLDGLDESMERDNSIAIGFRSEAPKSFAIEMVETDEHKQARAYTDGWQTLELTDADARRLATEMEALVERYVGRNGPKRYIVHRGLAADARHRWRSATDDIPG
jgi:hypothetical protein